MQHLNSYRFYELAAKLHGLFASTSQLRVAEMFAPLTETQAVLDSFIKGDPIALDSSRADATRLLDKIGAIFEKYYIDSSARALKNPATSGEDRIDAHDMALLHALVEKFEHALAAELNHAPTYTAQKRGIYSTYDLIENAHETFSPTVLGIMPNSAKSEFDVAGRALAFGLGSAAAMHLLRAIEIVLKKYYELFSGTAVAKNERNYGIYLKKLATLAEDETISPRLDKRLLQMLAQIKEHYRNPLTSPDQTISADEATSLFGLATAAITMMAEQIILRQKTKNDPRTPVGKEFTKTSPSEKPASKEAKSALTSLADSADDEEEDDVPLSRAS